jgi:predicted Zn-dependent protease
MYLPKKTLRSRLLVSIVALLLLSPWLPMLGSETNTPLSSSPLAWGAEKDKNPYDKFRTASYTNQGLMSEEDEIKLGEQVHAEVGKQFKFVSDPAITGYVQRLGERLARESKRPDLKYHFSVIEDPTVNAFALPGGYIYVHTGLLNTVESESELASVVGHEIGHVVGRHGLKNVKKAQRYQLIFGGISAGIGIIGGGSTAAQYGQVLSQALGAGLFTKHSRDAEREADFLGLHDIYQERYDPRGMISMFEKLGQLSKGNPDLIGSVFATHPPAAERIRNTQAEITDHLSLGERMTSNTTEFDQMKRRFKELGLDKVPMKRPKKVNN